MNKVVAVILSIIFAGVTSPALAQDAVPSRLVITHEALRRGEEMVPVTASASDPQSGFASRSALRPPLQRVARAIGFGILGFFLGGIVGAKIEGDCACDDPGLEGIVIGAPIGAVVGVILGAR